jgi:hypothetical protein
VSPDSDTPAGNIHKKNSSAPASPQGAGIRGHEIHFPHRREMYIMSPKSSRQTLKTPTSKYAQKPEIPPFSSTKNLKNIFSPLRQIIVTRYLSTNPSPLNFPKKRKIKITSA